MKNDKVIYTVLLGDYDEIIEPVTITPGWDYVCFTDRPRATQGSVWQMRMLDTKEGVVLASRRPKIMFHRYFEAHYNIGIYIDGNIRIAKDLNLFLDVGLPDGYDMATLKHPGWNCVYYEADAIVRSGKADKESVDRQIARYAREGLPKNAGMIAAYLLVFRNHNKALAQHCDYWFGEFSNPQNIRRDQISFNYLLWKHQLIKLHTMTLTDIMGNYFEWLPHSH